jgi:hypothetical protein
VDVRGEVRPQERRDALREEQRGRGRHLHYARHGGGRATGS